MNREIRLALGKRYWYLVVNIKDGVETLKDVYNEMILDEDPKITEIYGGLECLTIWREWEDEPRHEFLGMPFIINRMEEVIMNAIGVANIEIVKNR